MAVLTGYDAAYPPSPPPATDVVCFYGGGDTPHVWTAAEIAVQPARYRLPIFVRSNPAQANATADASAFFNWLRSVGCPLGSCTVLDIETAIDVGYVSKFTAILRFIGYKVLLYGSASTLFANPRCDGYFVALPGSTAIPPNCVGVQYGQGGGGAWDLDWFLPTLHLWDTHPAPPIIDTKEYEIMDSVVAQNGDIVSHAVTPAGHYLEITRKAGNQGLPATDGLEIIDITAQYPQFTVQP